MARNVRADFWESSWIHTLPPGQDWTGRRWTCNTASGSGRPARPARRRGSHKGKQVTLLCTSPKKVWQLPPCSPITVLQLHAYTSTATDVAVKQVSSNSRCSSCVSLIVMYTYHAWYTLSKDTPLQQLMFPGLIAVWASAL